MTQLKIILDLCCYAESDQITEASEYEEEVLDGMDECFKSLHDCSLDKLWFDYKDINQKVFVMDDGGDILLLKDGSLVNVCWRGDQCRVWKEDGRSSKARYIKSYYAKQYVTME